MHGVSDVRADTAEEAIKSNYAAVLAMNSSQQPFRRFQVCPSGDAFFMNFRADRAREIARSGKPKTNLMGNRLQWSMVLGMVEYSTSHNDYMRTFPKQSSSIHWVNGSRNQGKSQFRLAETENTPCHVFPERWERAAEEGEARYMAPSPKVATYDLQPEMSG